MGSEKVNWLTAHEGQKPWADNIKSRKYPQFFKFQMSISEHVCFL